MSDRKPVFYDPHKRRWRLTRRAIEIQSVLLTILLAIFAVRVMSKINLPEMLPNETRPGLHALREKPADRPILRKGRRGRVASLGKRLPNLPSNYDPIQAAFYVPWDSTSLASLKANYGHIDLLIPESLHAVSANGHVDIEKDEKLHDWLQKMDRRLVTMPLVNNYDGKVWRVPEMAAALANPESRRRLVRESFVGSRLPAQRRSPDQHSVSGAINTTAVDEPE